MKQKQEDIINCEPHKERKKKRRTLTRAGLGAGFPAFSNHWRMRAAPVKKGG
jgi:hypothetical protein